ncbi:unnamed protein product [Linum tenue]|uniref:Uncharacterized protein n=1 Tax=Linum tenue TaxID=586396 RepID=A0AAV0I0U7_9ROSI|nr:unnamed protein product [Linum tenue]
MSLYIGNLSSRIHKDELERVFQKFGRCDVRMKDGYGFVVYEFPPNAEKALKALQKKYICGQPLTLTWSNKQPRPINRHGGRPLRRYDSQHVGFSARGTEYGRDRLGSPGQHDYRMLVKHEDERERRFDSDMLDEGTAFHHDDMKDFHGQEHRGYREDEMVENDRWDLRNVLNEHDVNDGEGFDRYEPYQDRIDDGNPQLGHSSGSPSQRSFLGDRRRDHFGEGNLKRKDACYSCGSLGHKIRNCPEKNFVRTNWSKFNQTDGNNVHWKERSEDETEISRSRETLGSGMDRGKNDVKSSSSRKHHELAKYNSSPIEKEVGTIKDRERKKRNRKESGSPKACSTKRGRRSLSSPDSDHMGSRSVPKSSKHTRMSYARSRSRSKSSRTRSLSSDSRSGSTSHRFRNTKSRLRSISPASLSLSVSLGQPLPSSDKIQFNPKGGMDAVKPAESREVVVEKEQTVESNTKVENSELEMDATVANSGSPVLSLDMEGEVKKGKLMLKDSEILSASLNVVKDPSTALTDGSTRVAMSSSPKRLMEIAFENSNPVMPDHVPCSMTKPESELSVISGTCNLTDISPDELCKVIKHYNLDSADEDARHLSPEAYFGSSRLWPWEIIYYRRLKKGPISVENYARRVEQNHKFGIVDKYIRSSSGWGELNQGNE